MCKQFGIARASYYKWLNREVPEQEKENLMKSKARKGSFCKENGICWGA